MRTQITFESDAFPMIPDLDPDDEDPDYEADEVNPGIFGQKLAKFVSESLRAAGIETAGPYAEDYGWIVELPGWGFPAFLACASDPENPRRFSIIFEPRTPKLWRLFRIKDVTPCNTRVTETLEQVLRDSGHIENLSWID